MRKPANIGMKQKSLFWGYWLVVGLTFLALLILAVIAFHALALQKQEDAVQRQFEAIQRAKLSVEAFSTELPSFLASQPSILLPIPRAKLSPLFWPDSDFDRQTFLEMSLSANSVRKSLLEAFLNSEPNQKNFWNLLLARHSFQNGRPLFAEQYLNRIFESRQDQRLANGFTIKAFSALLAAQNRQLSGDFKKAEEYILLMSTFPSPDPPLKPEGFWPETMGLPNLSLVRILSWAWSLSDAKNLKPGWVDIEYEKVFVYQINGQLRACSGNEAQNRLHFMMQRASGDGVIIDMVAVGTPQSEPIPSFSGLAFRWAENGKVSREPRIFNRVVLGFIVASGVSGLAFIVLLGLKRDQEHFIFSVQELFYRQAAHDLKTPLSTIRALAETILLKRVSCQEQESKYLNQILKEADRSAEVVDSMLLAARLRTGLMIPKLEPLEPVKVMKTLVNRFSTRLDGWNIEIQDKINPVILADIEMFERVLVNQIENVFRHASSGKNLAFMVIETASEIEIRIGDRGNGIANEITSESLSRDIPPSKIEKPGFGIPLMKTILKLHKGTLSFSQRTEGGLWTISSWKKQKEEEKNG